MNNKTSQKKIFIIGAGIAGLAAANQLQKYGYQPILLEARNRLGGRIWDDDIFGITLPRGAAWIHGIINNPIAELAVKYHAKFQRFDFSKHFIFDHKGQKILPSRFEALTQKLTDKLNQAQTFALEAKSDMSLAKALAFFYNVQSLSVEERIVLNRKKTFFECYVGAGYEFLSARHWNQEESMPGDNCIMTEGYRPIIQGLSQPCAIVFNTIVREINERADKIEIVTDKENYFADAIIVTTPLGVLKKNSIKFHPELPDFKQKAINNLAMGLLNLTGIRFPKIFWPIDSQALSFPLFKSPATTTFLNFSHFIKHPILLGNTGGESARELENYSDQDLMAKIVDNLRNIFGNNIPNPTGFYTTRWHHDPFSFGAYSYIPVGGSGDDYDNMAKPISDRIFFAGEATHRQFPATTHGAYLSGVREAARIHSNWE